MRSEQKHLCQKVKTVLGNCSFLNYFHFYKANLIRLSHLYIETLCYSLLSDAQGSCTALSSQHLLFSLRRYSVVCQTLGTVVRMQLGMPAPAPHLGTTPGFAPDSRFLLIYILEIRNIRQRVGAASNTIK